MLAVIGYSDFDKNLGQVRIEHNKLCNGTFGIICLVRDFSIHNKLSAIPLFNLYTGISKIAEAILYSEPNKNEWRFNCVIEEDFSKYRVLLILTGLAELTLVGGWMVHGVTTVYFYATRNTQGYMGLPNPEKV